MKGDDDGLEGFCMIFGCQKQKEQKTQWHMQNMSDIIRILCRRREKRSWFKKGDIDIYI